MSDTPSITAKKRFPKATVEVMWDVIEMLRPGLACDRIWGAGDKDCPDFGDRTRGQWCPACQARSVLESSHKYTEHMELLRPSSMDPTDPRLTRREKLLCAIQGFANAWKQGGSDSINQSKSQLTQSLDVYEFDLAVACWNVQKNVEHDSLPTSEEKLPVSEEENTSKRQPDLAGTLKWLDEREAFRLTTMKKGSDPTVLGYPGWAAKMLRELQPKETTEPEGGKSEAQPTREPSTGLKEILNWLETEEADYQVANEHTVGVPLTSRYGRAARLLRFFHSEWSLHKDAQEELEGEILRLRVLLGHMPRQDAIVEIAYLGDRVALRRDSDNVNALEWRARSVERLWYVGVHDDPGFTISGAMVIYTQEDYGKLWRYPKKERKL